MEGSLLFMSGPDTRPFLLTAFKFRQMPAVAFSGAATPLATERRPSFHRGRGGTGKICNPPSIVPVAVVRQGRAVWAYRRVIPTFTPDGAEGTLVRWFNDIANVTSSACSRSATSWS